MCRMQAIEFSHSERAREAEGKRAGGRLSLEENLSFSGAARVNTALMVCPKLLEHVKQDVERDASLAKKLRKAREEREALRKKGGKDGKEDK